MARKLRLEYPGAIYHVMNRGDRREPIFKDDFDRQRFLQTLGEVCAKTAWQIHAFRPDEQRDEGNVLSRPGSTLTCVPFAERNVAIQ